MTDAGRTHISENDVGVLAGVDGRAVHHFGSVRLRVPVLVDHEGPSLLLVSRLGRPIVAAGEREERLSVGSSSTASSG